MAALITSVCSSLPNSALSVWLVLVLWVALDRCSSNSIPVMESNAVVVITAVFPPRRGKGRAKNDVTVHVFWTLIYQVAVSRSQNSSVTSISLTLSQMRGQGSSSITPLSSHGRDQTVCTNRHCKCRQSVPVLRVHMCMYVGERQERLRARKIVCILLYIV